MMRKLRVIGGRRCSVCGKVYHRCNRIRVWTAVNPGHQMGWMVEDLKVCTTCFNAKKAQRVVSIATIALVTDQRAVR